MTLLRRTPMKRKRTTARRWKSPRCIGILGTAKRLVCRKPAEHLQRCRKHRDHYLDLLWSIKNGEVCELADLHDLYGFPCIGPIQGCHGLDRDEKPVRWSLLNRFWGCASANAWGHHNKRRWYAYVKKKLGEIVYAELEEAADRAARSGWEPDFEAIERELLADCEHRGSRRAA